MTAPLTGLGEIGRRGPFIFLRVAYAAIRGRAGFVGGSVRRFFGDYGARGEPLDRREVGRTNGRTNGWTNGWTNFSICPGAGRFRDKRDKRDKWESGVCPPKNLAFPGIYRLRDKWDKDLNRGGWI